jgi:glutaredoxin
MSNKLPVMRNVEVFSAGCPCCDDAVKIVNSIVGSSDHVVVHDMRSDAAAQAKAKQYGIKRVPAVVINGQLADCCKVGGGVDAATLQRLGVGQP